MIRQVPCRVSNYRPSRHERDVDGDRLRRIVENITDIDFVLDIVVENHDIFLLKFLSCQSFRSTS